MKHLQLNNGMQFAWHHTNLEVVHIGLYIKAGTIDEYHYPPGIAHFIEHMVFKGTNKFQFQELSEKIDALGGEVNAYTTKTYTCYTIKTLKRFEAEAIELLEEMVFHATFPPDEIEKERQVILEEIKMIEDDDEERAFEQFESELFKGTVFSTPILGTVESVNAITRNMLQSFYYQFYQTNNMILSYVGTNEQQIKKIFQQIDCSHSVTYHDKEFKVNHVNIEHHKESMEQAHVILAHEGIGYRDEQSAVYEIINNFYGGSMTSFLFRKLRESLGLCYALYSSVDAYKEGGVLYTYFATDAKNITLCLEEINKIHNELAQGINIQLLTKTQHYLVTNLYMNLDYDGSIMEHMGKSLMLYNKIYEIEALEQKIMNVTLDEVNNALKLFEKAYASYRIY
ncbi:M16 family metallopeptidase [Macrococcus armenti]|uniref:M16 family metallopeptidase n=1 Tax=Macrococcus armenti TaxID=2875764 RepID=UPI001CCE8A2E|nr:pitrilysin family protein [Macrococcus armenti]UBH16324.1 insulinase family protein [Macrococcus armenti]UBH18681.1 insulinase family protein [Macrococcus armenti]UBH20952.1 insulinase family protein [Macrococcus armenti]